MNKTIKRTLAIVMAVAMLFALSATAFADNDITVYVTIQAADIPEGDSWNYTLGTIDVTDTYASLVPVTVPANSTVKDVVEAMATQNLGVTIVNSCSCGNCGTHTSYGCTCSNDTCTCTWKQVANVYWNGSAYVPDGTYSSALNSLKYAGITYTNASETEYTDNTHQHGTYTGTTWEYYTHDANTGSGYVYPNAQYMNQYEVSDGEYIVLSFDTSTFSW